MALTPTTSATLVTKVRQRTNMETNQFVTDPEIVNYLDDALALLDGILISKFSNYKLTKVLVTVNSGTNIITLPNDFLKMMGLDLWYNQGAPDGYCTVNEYGWNSRNDRQYPTSGNVGGIISPYIFEYRLEGNQITIIPPQAANLYTYRLNYIADYIPLSVAGQLQSYMDSQNWCQYAVYAASAQVLAKQDSDPAFFLQQASLLQSHIIELSAPARNQGEPKAVGIGGREYGPTNPYGWNW
jgi:hypothetical protein